MSYKKPAAFVLSVAMAASIPVQVIADQETDPAIEQTTEPVIEQTTEPVIQDLSQGFSGYLATAYTANSGVEPSVVLAGPSGEVISPGCYTYSYSVDTAQKIISVTITGIESCGYTGSISFTSAIVVPEEPAPPEEEKETVSEEEQKKEEDKSETKKPDKKKKDKEKTKKTKSTEKAKETAKEEEKTKSADSVDSVISNRYAGDIDYDPVVPEDFRFWTVASHYAFGKKTVKIKEDMSKNSRTVGKLGRKDVCYVLKDCDGWLYIESGDVRGFVKDDKNIIRGKKAEKIYNKYRSKSMAKFLMNQLEEPDLEVEMPTAKKLIGRNKNKAYTYLRATTEQTVIDKVYAAALTDIDVKEEMSEDARTVGELKENGLCFVIEDDHEDWVYIESGDVRGFVLKDDINYTKRTQKHLEENESDLETAKETIDPEENKALYYSKKSTKQGVPAGKLRNSIIEFASQFIGNPYVWGGVSLVNGCDCSGFVQSVYSVYGIDLPRVSAAQAEVGKKIPVEDALPGDLIFYSNGSRVYHVVIYAGNGETVEAYSESVGIVRGRVDYGAAAWATRVIDDSMDVEAESDLTEVNATEEMYGESLGNFKLTYYCACEKCCGPYANGITATGAPVVQGQTIAVDPSVIPYGTKVIINGHVFTAQDCGGAIKGNHIDIYVSDHNAALQYGASNAEVFLVK